jgi:hypothetical protein
LLAVVREGDNAAMNIAFERACEADVQTLLRMARAFHLEDGHPLDAAGEAAVVRAATGEPLAPTWIARIGRRAVGYVITTLGYSRAPPARWWPSKRS